MTDHDPSFPELLRQHGISPKKSLGQNFLFDERIIQRIIELAGITKDDSILEIGAGPGNLTHALASHSNRVVAIELDQRFLPLLKEITVRHPNLEIIHGDVLKIDLDALFDQGKYLVVANLPYYITSAVIRKLLETKHKPSRLVLTVQKEVAGRISAKPGEMSILAVSVQVFGSPRIALHIPAGAFYPTPKIDSSVLLIDTHPSPLLPEEQLPLFFRLVKAGFSQKRKMLKNTLSAGMRQPMPECEQVLKLAGIDPTRRAQTLSVSEWIQLTTFYNGQNSKSDA